MAGGFTGGSGGVAPAVWGVGATGPLDAAFGNAGIAELPHASPSVVKGIVVAPDDALACAIADATSPQTFEAARLHADGSVDTAFGQAGLAVVPFGGYALAQDIALSADGSLVMVGAADVGGQNDPALVRLLP